MLRGLKTGYSLMFGLLCLVALTAVYAQDDDKRVLSPRSDAGKVIFEYSDSLVIDKKQHPDYKLFVGNVRFRRDSMFMYCDSAHLYDQINTLYAFGNVKMEQGDTLFVYGDYLHYDGNTGIARLRDGVRLINRNVTLYTDSLNYNQEENVGYYFEGGKIVDSTNVLTSVYGQYSPDTKMAVFQYDVELTNPKYVLYSDTLEYSTESKIAQILGPSTIVSDSNTIYSDRGWYDTDKDLSMLLDRSIIVSKSQRLTGDTIYYNRNRGFGEVFGNMVMNDSVRRVVMEGQYGYYDEKSEFAFATDSALVIEYSGVDTLFLHADTLKSYNDTLSRVLEAYHGVRFYRNESQGVCDSMVYWVADSLLTMFDNPILWNENYQIFGDTIKIYMNDGTIDWAHIPTNAFASEQKDSLFFNQLSGKELKAFFQNGELKQVDMSGNVETIYYPQERDSTYIGLNSAIGGFLTMFLKDRTLDKMILYPQPKGVLTPVAFIKPDMLFLPRYQWFDYLRPVNKADVFRRVVMRQEDAEAAASHRTMSDADDEEGSF